jgi:hypothetical protein
VAATQDLLDAPVRNGPDVDLDGTRERRRKRCAAVGACLLLFAIYASVLLVKDPRGVLAPDSGGKLATLVSSDAPGADGLTSVGYWARADDPRGERHPLVYTSEIGGHWVQLSTLPMSVVAVPLFDLFGLRGALLVPALGSVLAALAARALARRLGNGSGWLAFWTVGLATPVAVYALDFWEHSWGLALMMWGVVHLVELRGDRRDLWHAAAAGLLFGAAASLRTEALVYAAVAGVALLVGVQIRERGPRLRVAAIYGAGIVAAFVLNVLLEFVVLGGSLRSGRVASTAAETAAGVGARVEDALISAVAMNGDTMLTDYVFGAVLVGLVVYGVTCLTRPDPDRQRLGVIAVAIAVVIEGAWVLHGLDFLPGLFVAAPIAACGAVLGWSRRTLRLPMIIATASLPVVWLTQYSGGVRPQWGSRYLLLSGALFTVAALVVLADRRRALIAAIAVSLALTAAGVVFTVQRADVVASGMDALVARHDQVVISRRPNLLREGGAWYRPDRRWLNAATEADVVRAVGIARRHGATQLAIVDLAGSRVAPSVGGFRREPGSERIVVRPGEQLQVVSYRTP